MAKKVEKKPIGFSIKVNDGGKESTVNYEFAVARFEIPMGDLNQEFNGVKLNIAGIVSAEQAVLPGNESVLVYLTVKDGNCIIKPVAAKAPAKKENINDKKGGK